MNLKDLFKITGVPVVFASLCCLAPLVLVLLGLSTAAFATSFSDTLYGQYRWYFRLGGLLLLAGSLFIYFRTKGVCTLDQAKRRRKQIINTVLISLVVFIVFYVVFLYVVVEFVGVQVGIWENPIPKVLEVFGR